MDEGGDFGWRLDSHEGSLDYALLEHHHGWQLSDTELVSNFRKGVHVNFNEENITVTSGLALKNASECLARLAPCAVEFDEERVLGFALVGELG